MLKQLNYSSKRKFTETFRLICLALVFKKGLCEKAPVMETRTGIIEFDFY